MITNERTHRTKGQMDVSFSPFRWSLTHSSVLVMYSERARSNWVWTVEAPWAWVRPLLVNLRTTIYWRSTITDCRPSSTCKCTQRLEENVGSLVPNSIPNALVFSFSHRMQFNVVGAKTMMHSAVGTLSAHTGHILSFYYYRNYFDLIVFDWEYCIRVHCSFLVLVF